MANKPSSKSKRSGKSAADSSVKRGGIMSLNKSQTTPFMKGVIILIIIAMVTLFLYGGFQGFVELFRQQQQTAATATDPVTSLANKYDPQITSFNKAVASYPTSYTLLVALADVHTNYAFDLMDLANKSSNPSTATMNALNAQWNTAFSTYKKAVKAKKPTTDVSVNYAISAYYSGDTTSAISIARGALTVDPNFAPAYYNLGIFYQTAGKGELAAAAFQKYLALDPTGANGNRDYATQQLKALGVSVPATGSVGATTTP